MLHKVAVWVSVILAVTAFSVGPIWAQVAGANLSGTVTDPSGAAIVGAQISVTNRATGVNRAVVTDSAGFFAAPNLTPGNYDVTVSAAGFAKAKELGIELTVGAQQVLNVAIVLADRAQ